MQPSAQGIASLFMGNPGALAQRVDQDRKTSPMGIPDDLRQLMALNIVTTETDAAKRQQALSQLQQMAPQGGQPPTVADSVRQQAQQKIQTRMMQEQQKQQALQQMVQQAQGLPAAPTQFGMAAGGIVSFQEGGRYETPYDRMNRLNQEDAAANERRVITLPEGTSRQEAEQVQMANPDANVVVEGGGQVLRDIGSALKRAFLYSSDVEAAKQRGKQQEALSAPVAQPEAIGPEVENLRRRAAAQMEERQRPVPAPSAPPVFQRPGSGIAAALPQVQQPAPQPAAPIEQEGLTQQGVFNAAAADRAMREAEYERRVGRPDRTQLDRLMAEYERQKAAAEGPKAGFDALAEYLGQIAATPRGMSSFEAGAAGARGVQAMQKERAAQRAALTEKQIMLEREQMKAERDYVKDLFNIGDQAYDRAMKTNMAFYTQAGEDKRTAQRMAHDKTMAEIRLANDKEVAKLKFDYDMQLRKTPPAERPSLEREYVDALEKKGIPRDQAIEIARSGGAGGERTATPTDRLRAAQSILNDIDASPEEKAMARSQITSIMGGTSGGLSMTMADVRATAKASGKTEAEVIAAAKAKGYAIK